MCREFCRGIVGEVLLNKKVILLNFTNVLSLKLRLPESETARQYNISVIIVSLLEILENFSLVLVFSGNMKSIIVYFEILDHIGITQTCDKKTVDCLKN